MTHFAFLILLIIAVCRSNWGRIFVLWSRKLNCERSGNLNCFGEWSGSITCFNDMSGNMNWSRDM